MIKCRACLKSGRNMIPMDEKYTTYFNLLTSLDIKLSTDDTKQLCKHCFVTLQQFIDFRKRCIAANVEFSNIIPKESIKQEDEIKKTSGETELKQELKIDGDEMNVSFEGDTTDLCELDSDIYYEDNFIWDFGVKKEEKNKNTKDIKSMKKKICTTKKKFPGQTPKNKNIKIQTTVKSIYKKTSETNLPCGLCTKSFEDNAKLETHLLTHKYYNSCTICDEKFEDWQEIMAHRINHLPGKQHLCHLCPNKFRSALYLEYHFRKYHSAGEKQTLRCRLCGRHFNTPDRLQYHFVETHNSKNKAFYCDYCNKLCFSKSYLKSHITSHIDIKPFNCDACDYASKSRSNLKLHKMSKHNPERVYCVKCKKVFASQNAKEKHVCKEIDSICPVCGKIFSSKSMVNRHLRTHDQNHWYKCDRCPAKFKGKSSLVVHQNKHDGIRKHACEFCPAKFYFASVLIKHRRTHTGIKPYVCKVCQKAFTGNHNLKVHMRVHGKFVINKKEPNDDGFKIIANS